MRKRAMLGAIAAGILLSACASERHSELEQGWDLMVAKDYAAARDHYERMLAEDPTNPWANLNLGVAYEELGDKEKAARYYQAAIANGRDAEIGVVAETGNVAERGTTVETVAQENLRALGS